jgi:hypothetical protein
MSVQPTRDLFRKAHTTEMRQYKDIADGPII